MLNYIRYRRFGIKLSTQLQGMTAIVKGIFRWTTTCKKVKQS